MIENILYVIIGFAVTYLSLELAWHFSVCRRIKDYGSDNKIIIKPCIFKQVKTVLLAQPASWSRYNVNIDGGYRYNFCYKNNIKYYHA